MDFDFVTENPISGIVEDRQFFEETTMEVHFTPEQEAQIVKTAKANGTDAEKLVVNAALHFVDDANFRAAVLEAQAYADRGEFIEEDEMDARLEAMLRS